MTLSNLRIGSPPRAWVALLFTLAACTRQSPPATPAPSAASAAPPAAAVPEALLAPEQATAQAPATFKARFTTTKGDFVVEVHRDWAPHGADRFYNLVKTGYFNQVAFFRAIAGFMVQFGIHGSGAVNAKWRNARIEDDPPAGQSNARGMVTFATSGPNSRTTQLFVNYRDNRNLDGMGFTPFGKIVSGIEVLDSLYQGYGEGAPSGAGPRQDLAQSEGNLYLHREFPLLDYVQTARLE